MDVTQGLRAGGPPPPQRPLVTGYVSRSQPSPAGFGDPLFVVLPTLSADYNYGPCRWAAEQGAALPLPGAEVLVAFDDNDAPVVVWWDGAFLAETATGTAGGVLAGTYPDPTFAVDMATQAELDATTTRVAALEADRRVRGTVSAAGSITAGAGFTVSRTGTGTYVVTFTPAFSGAPSVTFGVGSTAGVSGVKAFVAPTASGFTALTFNAGTGANTDGEFHFIAEGPA